MEAACDGDVFKPTNLADDPIMLNIDSTAVVRNVAIFQHFLLNWKIWEKAKQGVLEMLLATIDILVHGSHCYYTFNIIQFQKAQLVQQILIGCQVSIFVLSGGEWLSNLASIKGVNNNAKIYVGSSTTVHILLFCSHTLCIEYATQTF